VDLNDIVSKHEKLLLRLIREDIEISTICTKDELIILADIVQIEQVLMNLVTNARDAMPHGGRIVMRTEKASLDERFIAAHGYGQEGEYALLSISDTGEGMDAETKERIFEPFFTTKEQGKGTGLGLAMVYGIVKQHSGHIAVYSEPGMGTTFKIYLPLVKRVATEKPSTSEAVATKGGTETILVAEDDAALRKLTSTILSHRGYRVIEAVDGHDAVAKFAENSESISLIILDGIMPKKNGREAYEEIRTINPAIKTIFLSGYAEDVISKKGVLDLGINFLLKPVLPTALLKRVREVLDS
jgi:CheY-like chemotaxis protein